MRISVPSPVASTLCGLRPQSSPGPGPGAPGGACDGRRGGEPQSVVVLAVPHVVQPAFVPSNCQDLWMGPRPCQRGGLGWAAPARVPARSVCHGRPGAKGGGWTVPLVRLGDRSRRPIPPPSPSSARRTRGTALGRVLMPPVRRARLGRRSRTGRRRCPSRAD